MTLLLIDALNLIRRIYAQCESQSGANTSEAVDAATLRVSNATSKLLKSTKADYALAVFDGTHSWRKDYYSGYKETRKPMSDFLRQQLPKFMDTFVERQVSTLCGEQFEADDLIATLASKAASNNINVVIVSNDKGYIPLLSEQVSIYDYFNKRYVSFDDVKEKHGVDSHQLWQYLALVGDKTNDIPGVPGVGKKSALAILQQAPSVKAALSDNPDGKIEQRIAAHLQDYVRALALVSLRTDIDLGLTLKQLRVSPKAQRWQVT